MPSEDSESDSESGKGKKGADLANGGPKETFGVVVASFVSGVDMCVPVISIHCTISLF